LNNERAWNFSFFFPGMREDQCLQLSCGFDSRRPTNRFLSIMCEATFLIGTFTFRVAAELIHDEKVVEQ
jgi:hypothetical protein